ncbi:MAG: NADH oxidase, partial [Clostridia bacterium]|nr:NADH oxidase [Clostridia bacterium]
MSANSPLLKPIKVGPLELKNRIMFPPLTTGYEERDGSIGPRSLNFYERLAKGGVGYIVMGDVSPVRTFSPTPKLF